MRNNIDVFVTCIALASLASLCSVVGCGETAEEREERQFLKHVEQNTYHFYIEDQAAGNAFELNHCRGATVPEGAEVPNDAVKGIDSITHFAGSTFATDVKDGDFVRKSDFEPEGD